MFLEIKKTFMRNILNSLSQMLTKIAEKHNLDYEELEEFYLTDIKNFLDN